MFWKLPSRMTFKFLYSRKYFLEYKNLNINFEIYIMDRGILGIVSINNTKGSLLRKKGMNIINAL